MEWPAFQGLHGLGRSFAQVLGNAILGTSVSPEAIATVIDIETAGTWAPGAVSITLPDGTVATHAGLLMWGKYADLPEGVTVADVGRMTAEQQVALIARWAHRIEPTLSWAKTYGARKTIPLGEGNDLWYADEGDVWLANFWPAGVGKDAVIARAGEPAYDQNPGIPHATPYVLTTGDVATVAQQHLTDTLDTYGTIDDASEQFWFPRTPGVAPHVVAPTKAKSGGAGMATIAGVVGVGVLLALAIKRKGRS